ncbi:hypothetical protein D8674_017863 [Pyrus ussuriensis x Pyrus communis]|uniref:Uncharacterized protein n=1 Tax=Pyrus ussuriensis x Pyrus communis TaxID=2448454 RepID=A0A5N5HHW9_9ROSA|nr:hypothetical protein D8674_017863 [Pyrus ussuriensis x Pyrus communis]
MDKDHGLRSILRRCTVLLLDYFSKIPCLQMDLGVDLKSSKVCELGLFNYKAKHVFYPFQGRRFRCRYDYYWASIFKLALAEAPNEALPLNCRPNFGAAWLTKDKFKVNETYDCWYTNGISKVSLYHDGFFSCQAKDPSIFEMIRRYRVLLSVCILFHGLNKFQNGDEDFTLLDCQPETRRVLEILAARVLTTGFRRTCLLVVYISFAGWLAIQYGKRLGLPEMIVHFKNS